MATSEAILPFNSRGTILTDGSATTVYTCPTRTWAQVTLINIVDDGGASGAATVTWFDDSANVVYYLEVGKVMAANTSLRFEYERLSLDQDDEIRVTGASGYHVVVSAIENARRT